MSNRSDACVRARPAAGRAGFADRPRWGSRRAVPRLLSVLLCVGAGGAAFADDKADKAAAAESLPSVQVTADRVPAIALPATESTTVLDAPALERKQPATVFDAVKDTPGVSVDGGPRATGMRFNIRGFRGNEDVAFKIDGAVKGFEKYRFGAGVFIEPELIRSITIERGPSLTTGSGAIGGAVLVTTKSAADFLRPGERVGGLLKLGYNYNSNERLRMLAAFARPTARSDLLVTQVERSSRDFRLAGGERFPASATDLTGTLIKLGLFPTDALSLELSRTAYRSGPLYTPFDANSSNAFVGGYVHQNVDDETLNLRFNYEPPGQPLVKLRGTIAHETTDLANLMLTGAGQSTFTVPCTTTPCVWSPYGGPTGSMTDFWKYDIWTAELFNDSRYRLGPVGGVLRGGLQAGHNPRDLRRITQNPLMNGADGRYPSGFDSQQPPGTRSSFALIAQNAFTWSNFTLVPGVRWDRYKLRADGQAALNRLAAGVPAEYTLQRVTPAVAFTWRPSAGAWALTHRWSKGFRPPLITDYFGMDSASPCTGFFDSAGRRIAPLGCGDALQPTESINREYTVAWSRAAESSTQARFTFFRIATRNLIGASYLMSAGDAIVQPYVEQRSGLELELNHDARDWYAVFGVSRIWATRTNSLTDYASSFTAGIPGTTAGLTVGYRLFDGRLEIGYRVRQIFDQLLLPNATGLTASTQYCGRVESAGVVHAANTQQDLFAVWRPHRAVTASLSINNLYDRHWCNNGDELGNVIGLQGPGRSVRVSVAVQF